MKIWAYADCHFGTSETLKELELNPDYTKCSLFLTLIKKEKPDIIICIGDFMESLWDGDEELLKIFPIITKMRQKTIYKLRGNHDPDGGRDIIQLNGVTFLHGHQWERASDGFVERLHAKANSQKGYTVIAHTHQPIIGENFMDIGSLTITGTFGEINNTEKKLRYI